MMVAVDPGLNRSGVAMFVDRRLVEVDTVSIKASDVEDAIPARVSAMAFGILERVGRLSRHELVIEWPQIYQRGGGKSKGDPNVLLPLAAIAGYLMARFVKAAAIRPAEWKGQTTKAAMLGRIKERLTAAEFGRVPPRLAHDGWDAIGIGLHALGRLERRRVFPGASE